MIGPCGITQRLGAASGEPVAGDRRKQGVEAFEVLLGHPAVMVAWVEPGIEPGNIGRWAGAGISGLLGPRPDAACGLRIA